MSEEPKVKCPDCDELLKFIHNLRMDETVEVIGLCYKCGKAWREPSLGWKILDS